jgi:8-oxo-dGTP pyrophosphatase MutT (NUDIX family)
MDGKVTALVVREAPEGAELLLFQHPHAGIQVPAGTIEPGEEPQAAALREAAEETGLTAFAAVRPLGYRDEVLPEQLRMIIRPATVYSRPDAGSFDWVRIRTGITVRRERELGAFTQITYEERDHIDAPELVSYRITGWTPTANLAAQFRRHFFLLWYDQPTPERWQVETDNHRFTLFWAPLGALPTIVAPQAAWPTMLPATLPADLRGGAAGSDR